MDKLQKLKRGYSKAQVEDFNGIEILSVNKKHLDFLFSTVEEQRKEIERLKVVEQAYESLKKAL